MRRMLQAQEKYDHPGVLAFSDPDNVASYSGTDLCILINTSVKKKPGWRIFESTAVGITLSFTANTAHSYTSIVYCISIILFLQEVTAQCCFFDLLFSFSHQLWC